MTDAEIERRLRLPLATLCLAVIGGNEGDLREAKTAVVDAVARMMHAPDAKAEPVVGTHEGLGK